MANPISFSVPPPGYRPPRAAAPPLATTIPDDTYAGSVAATPPSSPPTGLLRRWGHQLAMAPINAVAGLGLFLIGPHHSRQQEQCYQQGAEILSHDSAFTARVAHSAFDGLLELMERSDLPGDTAAARLDFILWHSDSNRGSEDGAWSKLKEIFTHFHPDSPFVTQANDRGFAPDVADGRKWYNPAATGYDMEIHSGQVDQGSPQVGHFLTAVDIGRQRPALEKLLHTAALGHELIGDDRGPLRQTLVGLARPRQRALFEQIIRAAERGDRQQAHRLVEEVLPDLSDSGQEPGRVGNSRQDLLNTSYGMALGRLIRSGQLETRQEAARWLQENLGNQAPSLPWNDPR